jgi:hypothetical protein
LSLLALASAVLTFKGSLDNGGHGSKVMLVGVLGLAVYCVVGFRAIGGWAGLQAPVRGRRQLQATSCLAHSVDAVWSYLAPVPVDSANASGAATTLGPLRVLDFEAPRRVTLRLLRDGQPTPVVYDFELQNSADWCELTVRQRSTDRRHVFARNAEQAFETWSQQVFSRIDAHLSRR